jgi:hypothetical protein
MVDDHPLVGVGLADLINGQDDLMVWRRGGGFGQRACQNRKDTPRRRINRHLPAEGFASRKTPDGGYLCRALSCSNAARIFFRRPLEGA